MPSGSSKGAKRPAGKSSAAKSSAGKPSAGQSSSGKTSSGKTSSGKRRPANAPGTRTPRTAAQLSRREKQARALRNRLIAGAVILGIVGVVLFATARPGAGPSVRDQLESGAGSCRFDTKFDGTAADQGDHIPSPTFKVDPPAGGAHLAQAAPPGFYTEGRVPPDGQLVHAMEHGFVVLWHRPGLPAEKLDQLEKLSDEFGRELIVAPRPSLKGEMVVTAWHKRLSCAELVPEKVALFTRSYKDQGPEKGFL